MANSEEYLDLAADARQALRALLVHTEPGTGLPLHTAYNILGQIVDAADANEPIETEAERKRREEDEEYRRRCEVWKNTPRAERVHWVLNALGSDLLTMSEVYSRMAKEHPEAHVGDGAVRSLMTELWHSRDLQRTETGSHGKQKRWAYYRREMSPEVRALEQALENGRVA